MSQLVTRQELAATSVGVRPRDFLLGSLVWTQPQKQGRQQQRKQDDKQVSKKTPSPGKAGGGRLSRPALSPGPPLPPYPQPHPFPFLLVGGCPGEPRGTLPRYSASLRFSLGLQPVTSVIKKCPDVGDPCPTCSSCSVDEILNPGEYGRRAIVPGKSQHSHQRRKVEGVGIDACWSGPMATRTGPPGGRGGERARRGEACGHSRASHLQGKAINCCQRFDPCGSHLVHTSASISPNPAPVSLGPTSPFLP